MKKELKIIVLCFLFFSSIFAQVSKVGTTSGQFLKIGVGSRAASLGEAFSAAADDASAIYWNPAGMVYLQRNEIIFNHMNWLAGTNYDFLGMVIPTHSAMGTFGLFASSFSYPDDEVRTVFNPEGTGEKFGANDISLGVSYSRFLTDRFSFGINCKYIQQTIWSMSASAFALDIGTLYKSSFKNLKIGIVLTNFGTKAQMQGRANLLYVDPDPSIEGNNEQIRAALEMDNWDLPLLLRTGISFDLIDSKYNRVTVMLDYNHPNDNKEYLNSGFEYGINNIVFLRGGFRGFGMSELEGGLSLGGGVNLHWKNTIFKFDYAYSDYGILKSTERYTISFVF